MTEGSTLVSVTEYSTKSTVSVDARWGRESESTPVYAIVSAVAEVTGADPLELPSLNDVIDPEALNTLFTSRSDTAVNRVSFQYAGYEIVVRGSGEIRVESAPTTIRDR